MQYDKYNKTTIQGLFVHNERGINCPDTHHHANDNIDASKTHLNYELKDRGGLSAYQYLKEKYDKINQETKERTGKSLRKDAVVICSWVVTMPKDLSKEYQEDFFKESYNFFSKRYGEDKVISATVHLDEITPHMHFQFMPIVEKDGYRKLCAKDLETKDTMVTVHDDIQEYLSEKLGCQVRMRNHETDNGNKDVQELKRETSAKLSKEIEDKKKEIEKLTAVVKELTTILDNDKLKKIDVTPKKLVGGFKGLSSEQAQQLYNTAVVLNNEVLKKDKKITELEKEVGKLNGDLTLAKENVDDKVKKAVTKAVNDANDKNKEQEKLNLQEIQRLSELVKSLEDEKEEHTKKVNELNELKANEKIWRELYEKLKDYSEDYKNISVDDVLEAEKEEVLNQQKDNDVDDYEDEEEDYNHGHDEFGF
jgi:hypothetical protein